jgi:hypothetical protein
MKGGAAGGDTTTTTLNTTARLGAVTNSGERLRVV